MGDDAGVDPLGANERRLWAREPEVVESVPADRQNRLFLEGFRLSDELAVTNDLDEALQGADVVVVAVPSQHLRATMTAAQPFVPDDAMVVSVAKGIELQPDCGCPRCSPRSCAVAIQGSAC